MKSCTDLLLRQWAFLLAFWCLSASHALGQASPDAPSEIKYLQEQLSDNDSARRINSLNRLSQIGNTSHTEVVFPLLHDTDPSVRRVAQAAIWRLWGQTGDEATDMAYQQGLALMNGGDLPHAIDVFTQLLTDHPLFAEAWNKRATLYFMLGQYDLSIQDCEQVLKLEPRHFGALSGYARMLISKGQLERALDYMERANAVNPQMQDAEEVIRYLRQQLRAKKNNMV